MAENYTGKNISVLFGKETTWGTPVPVSTPIGLCQGASSTERNGFIVVYGLGSRLPQSLNEGQYEATGSIDFIINQGNVFQLAIGPDTIAGTGPYTHTITPATGDTQAFTLQLGMDGTTDIANTFAGCRVGSLSLTSAINDVLKGSIDWQAKTVALGTSTTAPIIGTDKPFNMVQSVIKTGASGSEVAVAQVDNFGLTYNNNFEGVFGLGSRLLNALSSMNVGIEFRLSARFVNTTEYKRFLGNSAPQNSISDFSTILNFDNGLTGLSQRKLVITLSNCQYLDFGATYNLDGHVMQDLTGIAKTLSLVYTDNTSTAY